MKPKRDGRLVALDLMRGVAASAVLVEHGGYHFIPNYAAFSHELFSIGKFGLAAFFLVSGFVIPLSLERHPDLRRFWILRFFRLFPIYWFSLVAVLVMAGLGVGELLTPEFRLHLVRNAVINISMLQGIMKVPHAIGLYYTLTIELIFYMACSVLVALRLFYKNYVLCWLILLVASAMAIAGPLFLHRRVEMAGLFYVTTLAFGTVAYRLYKGDVSRTAFGALASAMAVFVVVGVWLNYSTYKKDDAFEHYSFLSVLLPWLSAYLLFGCLLMFRRMTCPAPALWIGKISYSLYLLHPLVLSLFGYQSGHYVSFGAFIGATVLVSSVTFLYIEKPAMKFGQRLISPRLAVVAV